MSDQAEFSEKVSKLNGKERDDMLVSALVSLRLYNRLFGPIQHDDFNSLRAILRATPVGGIELPK